MDVQAMLAEGSFWGFVWAVMAVPAAMTFAKTNDPRLSMTAMVVGLVSFVAATVCAILAAGWPS